MSGKFPRNVFVTVIALLLFCFVCLFGVYATLLLSRWGDFTVVVLGVAFALLVIICISLFRQTRRRRHDRT
jgi:uncharacterized membrane protein YhaH (DUF805 family)